MYSYMNNMPPPWAWPTGPAASTSDPAAQITQWISSLEHLKKAFKEEKKDDKDKKKEDMPSPVTVALFMILLSPITGPLMSKFFSMGIGMLPHATP